MFFSVIVGAEVDAVIESLERSVEGLVRGLPCGAAIVGDRDEVFSAFRPVARKESHREVTYLNDLHEILVENRLHVPTLTHDQKLLKDSGPDRAERFSIIEMYEFG